MNGKATTEKLAIDGGTPVRTDPFPSWPIFGKEEERAIWEVIHSQKWGGAGPVVFSDYPPKLPQFEKKFGTFQDAAHVISVVNGTVAITVALKAAGVRSGDEVIMPPYTFIGTASAALAYGALPVFVDIEADTLLIDPEKIEPAITPRTKAIVAVHLGGLPCNMTRLKEIASKHNLILIEDAAQAVGAQWEGKGVGAIGDLGTFSFQSSKNLTAGEGGAITTDNTELSEIAWSLCNCGRLPKGGWYEHRRLGQNYRMTEFQGAMLLTQMNRLLEQTATREKNGRLLDQLIGEIDGLAPLRRDPRVTRHGYHLYGFRITSDLADRIRKDEFVAKVQAEGIPVGPGYQEPLNRNEAVIAATEEWSGEKRLYACPVAERAAEKEVFRFTQSVLLADEQAMRDIGAALRKVMAALR